MAPTPRLPSSALYWRWERWMLGHSEFRQYGPKNPRVRPAGVRKPAPATWLLAHRIRFGKPIKPPPPPPPNDTPDIPLSPLLKLPTVWVNRLDGISADVLVSHMQQGGQKVAILPVLDGTEYVWGDGADWRAKLPQYVTMLHDAGFKAFGWQWGKAQNPELEAQRAAEARSAFGFDGWWMNGEKPYEGGWTSRLWHVIRKGLGFDLPVRLSGRWVLRMRELVGHEFPLGWTPEPRLDLDHAIFQQEGVAYGPQAYPFENGWDVEACVRVAIDLFGYSPYDVIPLVGVHREWDMAEYAGDARWLDVRPLILYPGDAVMGRYEIWKALGAV